MRRSLISLLGCVVASLIVAIAASSSAGAQYQSPTATKPVDFSFDNFAGTYHLDRDSKGVAVLTVQEDMTTFFPPNSHFWGIDRSIPKTYQGHDLNLKVISVTDINSTPIPYTTQDDGHGNEVIETGDKDIILSGVQTYRILYQTSGVVTFNTDNDEFLIDVNGRGWQETFGSVKAFIHLASSFSSAVIGKPSCYIGTTTASLGACTIQSNLTDGGLITAATTQQLTAHQALVVDIDFKKGTFQQKKPPSHLSRDLEIVSAVVLFGCGLYVLFKYVV